MNYVLLVIVTVIFAVNMGGSNFAAAFSAAHGGGILPLGKSQLLFFIFVLLGAVTLGSPVANTLGHRIVPEEILKLDTVTIILTSAAAGLCIANLLRVPQSTSLVTVAAISGVGAYFGKINMSVFPRLAVFWVFLPLAGYFITYCLGRMIYPPRANNFWIYEKFINHQEKLKVFVIVASCYNAFSVGSNNVANAVGPILGSGILTSALLGFLVISPFFGAGSIFFRDILVTTGKKIVPLGLFTATLICFVTGTLMIIASIFGVPQSFVMLKMAAVFAIGGVKDGQKTVFTSPVTRNTYITWAVTPVLAFVMSLFLTWVRYDLIK